MLGAFDKAPNFFYLKLLSFRLIFSAFRHAEPNKILRHTEGYRFKIKDNSQNATAAIKNCQHFLFLDQQNRKRKTVVLKK